MISWVPLCGKGKGRNFHRHQRVWFATLEKAWIDVNIEVHRHKAEKIQAYVSEVVTVCLKKETVLNKIVNSFIA